jgi:CRISPR-associated protein Cas1
MAWRGLHLTRPSRLTYADGQIVVTQDDGEVRVPLEDVAWIILDSPQSTLTTALLSGCMASGIAIMITDERHTPSGLALPFHGHHRQAEVASWQLGASTPLKKRLWQSIVRSKIINQATVLDQLGHDGGHSLREMARRVVSGDKGNIEASAARYYWGRLWPSFRRDDAGDRRNMLLNYGYAVVRSAVARSLVASGLLPALGLHHASVTNAFNLADDLVEPFRPFVDILAWHTSDAGAPSREEVTLEHRRAMAGALLMNAKVRTETVNLLTASELVASSLVRSFQSAALSNLELPSLEP